MLEQICNPVGCACPVARISRHLYRLYMNERPGSNARSVKQDADKPRGEVMRRVAGSAVRASADGVAIAVARPGRGRAEGGVR
jgi:hypothetical protein